MNLVIGDKEYPAVQYKDGWIWVDESSKASVVGKPWYILGNGLLGKSL